MPRSDGSKGGRPAFEHVFMFRVVPLQAMHRLLGERSEYLVKDRLVDPLRGSTMRFLGLDLCLALRDHMPAEVARCLAERIITKAWANAVDLLGDDDNLPPGFTSWSYGRNWVTAV